MSKLYRRKATGLIILSGEVTGIEEGQAGNKTVKILIREHDSSVKQWKERTISAVSSTIDDDVAVGCIATAIGYQGGVDTIYASSVTTGAKTRYIEDVEVVSGPVYKAFLNTETNEDGSQKLRSDGSPRKPHFDITIKVPDEEGHNIQHRIKIYNYKENQAGRETEIEKAQRIFKNWIDHEETPVEAVIVTKTGQTYDWENEYKGRVYQNFACDHLGKESWDFNWLGNRGERSQPAQDTTPAPTPTDEASVPMTAQAAPTGMFGSGPIHVEDDSYM